MSQKTRVLGPKESLRGSVSVPPSKSYTHRAVVMASLAKGDSEVSNPLYSRDTNATIAACKAMGARISQTDELIKIRGTSPKVPEDIVNVENSGTTLRFMTSVFALTPKGYTVLTGDSSIRRRPMGPILETLRDLGVDARSARENDCAPVIVRGGGIEGGMSATIRGDVSSQFISSLLISLPKAHRTTSLAVTSAVSRPYIDATIALTEKYGIRTKRKGYEQFELEGGQEYRPYDFVVPADFSSAAFMMAAIALIGGEVEFKNLDATLPQGDSEIMDYLKGMGATVRSQKGSVIVASDGEGLKGGKFNLADTPDLLPVVAVLGLRSDAPVEVTGVEHARFKETDRIAILVKELSKLGVKIDERRDGMKVYPPSKLKAALLDAHDDHRMFMAFSLASMLIEGGTPIIGVESLDVSYPTFLEDLKRLGGAVKSEK